MFGIFVLVTGCLLGPISVLGQPLGDYISRQTMGGPLMSGGSRRMVQVQGPLGARTSVTDVHTQPGFSPGSPYPVPVKHIQTRNSQIHRSPSMMMTGGIGPMGGTFIDSHGVTRSRSQSDVLIDGGVGFGGPVQRVRTHTSSVKHQQPGLVGAHGMSVGPGLPVGHGMPLEPSVAEIGAASGGTVDLVPGRRPGTVVESVHIPLPAVRQTSHVDAHGVHENYSGGPTLHVETEHGLPGHGPPVMVPPVVTPVVTPVRRRAHIDPHGRHGNFRGVPSLHVETEHSVGHVVDPHMMTPGLGHASGLLPVQPIGAPVERVSHGRSHVVTSSHVDGPRSHGNPLFMPAEHIETHGQSERVSSSSVLGPAMIGGPGMIGGQGMIGGPGMIGGTGMIGGPAMVGGPAMIGGQAMIGGPGMMGGGVVDPMVLGGALLGGALLGEGSRRGSRRDRRRQRRIGRRGRRVFRNIARLMGGR